MADWHVLTIGHLSRNRFWGESEDKGYRKPLATCTLIQTGTENIIVDPSLPDEAMQEALFDGSGLKPEQITKVYTTHMHFDHYVSPGLFANAYWYMAGKDLQSIKDSWSEYRQAWKSASKDIIDSYHPARDELVPGVAVIPLPGHTAGLSGLLFQAPEGNVLVTGDAVMTKEFFKDLRPYFFCWDMEHSIQSMVTSAKAADVIVPGHGEAFMVKAYYPDLKGFEVKE